MLFKKELRKVLILLGIGLVLTFGLIFATMNKYGLHSIHSTDTLDLICIFLYPLGIVYNWRIMFGLATVIKEYVPPSRYYTVAERFNYKSMGYIMRFLWIGLVLALGWIPGVYIACRNLYYLKKNKV